MNRVKIELSPFDALTIMTLTDLFRKKLEHIPDCSRILDSINNYKDQVIQNITPEEVEDAIMDKEIFMALNNIKE